MKYAVRKIAAVAAVAALAAALVTGCAPAAAPTTEGTPASKSVKIGFAAPLTGDNAI